MTAGFRRGALAIIPAGVLLAGWTAGAHEAPAEPDPVAHVFEFEPPEPGSYSLPAIREAADGMVLDTAGRARSLKALMAGRIVLLSFIYAGCEVECPLGTAALYDVFYASGADPALESGLKLVSLSFDPVRDTPEAMASYGYAAEADAAGKSPWDFLTTTSREMIDRILAGYGQIVTRTGRDDGPLHHLLRVYLIDRRGRVRNIYGLEFLDPRLLLADIRTLLLEEQAEGH